MSLSLEVEVQKDRNPFCGSLVRFALTRLTMIFQERWVVALVMEDVNDLVPLLVLCPVYKESMGILITDAIGPKVTRNAVGPSMWSAGSLRTEVQDAISCTRVPA